MNGLISSGHHSVATLTVLGAVFLVLAATAIAATLQQWHQKIYNQPAAHGAVAQLVCRLVWIAGLLAYIVSSQWLGALTSGMHPAATPLGGASAARDRIHGRGRQVCAGFGPEAFTRAG